MKASDLEKRLGLIFKDPSLLRQSLAHSSYSNENPGSLLESNERLEFLGDAALGLVVAQELWQRYPHLNEGGLTKLRAQLVRQETLARVANSLDLGVHLKMGRGEEASGGRQRESNLASALEALIGAVLLDQGYEAVRRLVLVLMREEMASLMQSALPEDPKSRLQELVQSRGAPAPTYRVVAVEGRDHDRLFTVEVAVEGQVIALGHGKRKLEAEREAARQALEALAAVGAPTQ